jgi:type I restriction-modification system DNA methylase subunit
VWVLDPACGSGDFLYVSLKELLDLGKEVIALAGDAGLPTGAPLR